MKSPDLTVGYRPGIPRPMVVQFSCPGCQQPIEVDREWAGQHVACPFCQRVVTAPTESTITSMETELPHAARKMTSMNPQSGSTPRTLSTGYNRLAAVGLGLSLSALFLMLLSNIMMQAFAHQLRPGMGFQETQEEFLELADDPEHSRRFLMGLGALCMSLPCWLAGVIISSIALTRKDLRGRRLAVAGVTVSILVPLLFCVLPALFP